MTNSIPEKDWKYLRSIEKELLSELCRTINQKAAAIVHSGTSASSLTFGHFQQNGRPQRAALTQNLN